MGSEMCIRDSIAAVAGSIIAMFLSSLIGRSVSLPMMLNGALAGLVSITAGPDYPTMEVSVLIGAIGGVIMFFAVKFFDMVRVDDPVGALSVHLVPGIWGTLAVGIFKEGASFLTQLQGVGIIGAFVFASSFVFWYCLKKAVGLRTKDEGAG